MEELDRGYNRGQEGYGQRGYRATVVRQPVQTGYGAPLYEEEEEDKGYGGYGGYGARGGYGKLVQPRAPKIYNIPIKIDRGYDYEIERMLGGRYAAW